MRWPCRALLDCLKVLLCLALLELGLILVQLGLYLRLVLRLLVSCRIGDEGLELRCVLLLLCGGVGLETKEIALDDLHHTDDTTLAILIALVCGHLRRLPSLLQEGLLGIELLEDCECLAHGLSTNLCLFDGLSVLGVLLLALRCGHLDCLSQIRLLLDKCLDRLSHGLNGCRELLNLSSEQVHLGGFLV